MKLKKTQAVYLLICSLVVIISCKQSNEYSNNKLTGSVNNEILSSKIIADTIIYDVIIKNPNPSDNWKRHCLAGLNYRGLVDFIFEQAYSGNYIITNYDNGKEISINKLKRLEKDDDDLRRKIGKIQFTERWFYTDDSAELKKDIIAMVIGKEIINLQGEIGGYEAIFKLKLR